MLDAWTGCVFSRRGWLSFLAGAGASAWNRVYARPTDFWNKKPPAEWSSDEIDRLITSSPWAKQVSAEGGAYERGGSRGGAGDPTGGGTPGGTRSPRGGMGGPNIGIGGMGGPQIGIGGMGGPRMGGRGMGGGRGGGRGAGRPQMKGTVRWESAQPILEALKTPLPEAFAGHYVISVSGFPLRGGRRPADEANGTNEAMLDRLKSFTSLEPKGRHGSQPGVVQQQVSTGEGSVLFGFSKELLDLSADDKEATFSTNFGRLTIKAKFDLRAMMYHNKLAV